MSISRWARPLPAGVGPFEVGRARYFALRNEANRERRRNADTRIRILEANLTLQLSRLAQLRNDTNTQDLTRAERIERDRAAQRQARHVDEGSQINAGSPILRLVESTEIEARIGKSSPVRRTI